MSSGEKLRLGEILIEAGLLSESQLRSALAEQRWWGGRLGAALVGMELVSELALTRALASQLDLPIVTLSDKQIHPEVLALVPAELALKYQLVPLFLREESGVKTVFVAIGDPTALAALEELRAAVGMPASAVVVAPSELEAALARFYGPVASAVDEISHPTPQRNSPGSATPSHLSTRSPAQSQAGASSSAAAGRVPSPRLVVKALAQLLIDKGLIDQVELNDRVRALHAKRSEE